MTTSTSLRFAASRRLALRHILLPSTAPVLIVVLYFTPQSTFGCAARGYMAVTVMMIGLVAAIYTALRAVSARSHGRNEEVQWWMISTLILILPAFLVLGPLR